MKLKKKYNPGETKKSVVLKKKNRRKIAKLSRKKNRKYLINLTF